jgi:hypothetical protein
MLGPGSVWQRVKTRARCWLAGAPAPGSVFSQCPAGARTRRGDPQALRQHADTKHKKRKPGPFSGRFLVAFRRAPSPNERPPKTPPQARLPKAAQRIARGTDRPLAGTPGRLRACCWPRASRRVPPTGRSGGAANLTLFWGVSLSQEKTYKKHNISFHVKLACHSCFAGIREGIFK